MSEELICLSIPNFHGNEKRYVDAAIDAEWVSTAGAYIGDFEKSVADYVGVEQACACQSGTAGLHLCLRHFGVGPGDLVLVPTLTFIATINAVMYQYAEPVFFDCDEHMCIDVDQIEEYLERECRLEDGRTVEIASGKTVKAVIPVHVFGDHCEMAKLMELADRYHLYVIEDATESLGGVFGQPYEGKHTGTVGHAGVFSFNGNKIITTGGGGMVVSNEPGVVEHIRYLSQQAKNDTLYFVHEEYGYNYRMTNLQAALGLAQMEELPAFLEIKRKNYLRYAELLKDCSYAELLPFGCGEDHGNCWFYSLALKEADPSKRDRLIRHMIDRRIQVRPIWKLNHRQTPFLPYRAMSCRRAENFYDRVINIPCSTNLTEAQQDRVCEALLSFE